MKMRSITILLCCLLPYGAVATPPLPPLLLQSLHRLNNMQGFSAQFTQTITYHNGTATHYSGTIAVARPGKFRWQYIKPYSQTYVSDGKEIWHYEPDLMQAVRMDELSSIDPIAIQLLDGRITAKELTLISQESSRESHRERFTVRIRNEITVMLTLDQYGTLQSITHTDLLGNQNHIALANTISAQQDEAEFHFTPPRGVDIVIEGEQP
ncbi:MAG: outer membrane lipoprotein chaperone LolA [Mariprofundales bacterium]|nr:outer membrane lipoprotein chaperone LolA [Mariprofundales bacterium]